MKRTLLGALCAAGLLAAPDLQAEGYWLSPGDQRLRDDLTLLDQVDANGVGTEALKIKQRL